MRPRIQTRLVGAIDLFTPPATACPARAGDGIGLRAGARGAFAGNLEYVGPAVEHREKVIAVLHVGNAEDLRLLADVDNDVV